jgi:hypothetical protein
MAKLLLDDGIVAKAQVSTDQLFLDTTLFTPKFISWSCWGFSEVEEVILTPGRIIVVAVSE